jgi:hypothetical protein
MERRIAKKVENHQVAFKTAIQAWMDASHMKVMVEGTNKTSEFLQYIYDYDGLVLSKEDFQKRKRVKNVVPQFERCGAKRANGEQCTRRKKDDSCFCGTHVKGIPHGIVSAASDGSKPVTKVEVWVQEVMGIHYYIDADHNVYKQEDIVSNRANPQIIAKCKVTEDGVYEIPSFNI